MQTQTTTRRQLSWFEWPADDRDRSKHFWTSLCGWAFTEFDGPQPYDYHIAKVSDTMGVGIYPAHLTGDYRGFVVFFEVDDIEASVALWTELGGEVTTDIMRLEDARHGHSLAIGVDPDGNRFGLVQWDNPADVRLGRPLDE